MVSPCWRFAANAVPASGVHSQYGEDASFVQRCVVDSLSLLLLTSHWAIPLFVCKSIQAQSQADAHAILLRGVEMIRSWQTLYNEHFSSNLGTIAEAYSQESNLQANPALLSSLDVVRNVLVDELTALMQLETYIHLLMPQMEGRSTVRNTHNLSLSLYIYTFILYTVCLCKYNILT